MTRVFSVGIGVVIGAILVKPDILLWIPALNSPNVDTNVGVITILLAIWSIVRDSMREREQRASDAPPRQAADAPSDIPPPAPDQGAMYAPDTRRTPPTSNQYLMGAVITAATWFFARLFFGS